MNEETKKKRKIRVEGVGLDCSTITYKPSPDYAPDYLYIDTSANNAFYLSEFCVGRKLIVRVGDVKKEILEGLREDLGNSFSGIDVLLIPASLPNIDPTELREVLTEFEVKSVGIDRPGNLTQVKEAAESIKRVIIPSYLSLDLCPLHFQKDVIDWAEEEGLEIFGFNPFGGSLTAPSIIQIFTIPYLLSFSAAYSQLVFLSDRDLINAQYEALYLEELIGEEIEEKLVRMDKTVDRLVRAPEKLIRTGLNGCTEYDNPYYLTSYSDISFSFNPIQEEKKDKNEEVNPEVVRVLEEISKFNSLTLPFHNDFPTYMSILRPALLKKLGEALGPNCQIEQEKIGPLTFLVDVRMEKREKRYIWRDKVWYEYLVFVMWINGKGELEFKYYGENA